VLEGFDAAGAPKLRPSRTPITLRHLLTHSSGFVYDMWNADMARYLEVTGKPGIISCTNAALDLPLVFDPGTAWDYGIGIDWAGKAVEAVSGKTLGVWLAENLFAPLGMRDTGFRIRDDQRARLARIHARTPEGIVATDLEIPQSPEFEMGGGGLYATVSDYLRFARMILGGGALDGARVLAEPTVALMSGNAMGDLRCRPMKSAVPGSTNDVDFLDGMGPEFPDQSRTLANRPLRRLPGLGRPRQFLLLDRSGEAGGRRLRDTTAAILRRKGGLAVRRVRERGV
jgi:methyl acetate hydrolase